MCSWTCTSATSTRVRPRTVDVAFTQTRLLPFWSQCAVVSTPAVLASTTAES